MYGEKNREIDLTCDLGISSYFFPISLPPIDDENLILVIV